MHHARNPVAVGLATVRESELNGCSDPAAQAVKPRNRICPSKTVAIKAPVDPIDEDQDRDRRKQIEQPFPNRPDIPKGLACHLRLCERPIQSVQSGHNTRRSQSHHVWVSLTNKISVPVPTPAALTPCL